MGHSLLVAPSGAPVSISEAKLHLRVTGSTEDALISTLIDVATAQAEHLTGRALLTQKWRVTFDSWPCQLMRLPKAGVTSVDSVTYLDAAGVRQTLSVADWVAQLDAPQACVGLAYGKSWPAARVFPGSIQIDYTVGYANSSAVPPAIKQWILLAVGTLYENREAVQTGQLFELPRGFFDGLLDPYRVMVVV